MGGGPVRLRVPAWVRWVHSAVRAGVTVAAGGAHCRWAGLASPGMRVGQALPLAVDPVRHAEELARFQSHVVAGPEPNDCAIFCGPIGADAYGRFWVRRGGGERIMLRANRYALAASLGGKMLPPWEQALHGCDVPICVRVSVVGEVGLLHLVAGSQRENMEQMGRRGRGGGRRLIQRGRGGVLARREQSVALRAAVSNGWDAEAVRAALLGATHPTLW
jgi:hypothetical protein